AADPRTRFSRAAPAPAKGAPNYRPGSGRIAPAPRRSSARKSELRGDLTPRAAFRPRLRPAPARACALGPAAARPAAAWAGIRRTAAPRTRGLEPGLEPAALAGATALGPARFGPRRPRAEALPARPGIATLWPRGKPLT